MSILLDERTTVVIQGITGREARMVTGHTLAYGTRLVAGVTPGRGGQQVDGVPVFDTVRDAMRGTTVPITASLVYVPPFAALDAAIEACEAAIPLVVVMTERMPQIDACRMIAAARKADVTLVGPNTVGLITPRARAKVGAIGGDDPDRCFRPGRIGVVSRSGGMTGECAWLLRRSGLGVSSAVSVGGDPIIGLTPAAVLRLFEQDPETDGVVLWGEPGTPYEEDVAALVARGEFTKPLVAFVTGAFVDGLPSGTVFGHTAVIVSDGAGRVSEKRRRLHEAGITLAASLNDIGAQMKEMVAPS